MTNPQDPYNSGGTGEGYNPYGQPDNTGPGQPGGAGGYPSYPGGAQSGQQPGYGGQSDYGGQPGYGGYQSYPGGDQAGAWGEPEQKNGFALWALIISIVGIVMMISLILTLFAPLAGIVGLILGIIAVVKARKLRGRNRRMGMSVAAIILSAITIIIPVGLAIFSFVMLESTGAMECFTLTDPAQQQACLDGVISDLETP